MQIYLEPSTGPAECGACSWSGDASECGTQIESFETRVAPGEICPVGECPDCGALAHFKEKDKPAVIYRGVPVFLSGGTSPRFGAHCGGKYFNGGSFDTRRKKLDAALVFEPFDALLISRGELDQVRVIGVDMEEHAWCVQKGGHTHGGTRIKFYSGLFALDKREVLETHLGELEQWDKQESDIKEARAKERERLEKLTIKRPDGG